MLVGDSDVKTLQAWQFKNRRNFPDCFNLKKIIPAIPDTLLLKFITEVFT